MPIILSPVTPFPGYLQWPRFDEKIVNSTFGEYRTNHYHAGIDMPGGFGEFALATIDGVVVDRAPYGAAGNVVTILDSNGYMTNYLHLADDQVSDNFPQRFDPVSVGTPIGRIGGTGGYYPVHLHFEIRNVLPTPSPDYRSSGDAYNPLSWLDPPWTPTPTSGNRPPFLNNLYVVPEGSGSEIWVNTPAPYLTPLPDPHKYRLWRNLDADLVVN